MSLAPQLAPTEAIAVFLDFDGTLVDIVARPDLTHVPPGLLATLQAVYDAQDGALALITGRSLTDLDALLDPLHLPASGVHGIEFRNGSDRVRAIDIPALPDWARERITTYAANRPGLLLEDKGHSLALHYRQVPKLAAAVRDEMRSVFSRLGPDFVLQDGKMVLEVRPAGATKGTAIRRFMSEPPYAGRIPVFIGDDVTDEDAFGVVNELGGYSIKVGERHANSAARFELPDVEAVRTWLLPLTKSAGF